MKKIALGTLAIGMLTSTVVMAADMPLKAPPMAPAPVANWTGWYFGGNVGGIWGTDTGSVATGATPATTGVPGSPAAAATSIPLSGNNPGSVLGGLQTGYNYQINNFLLGVEADGHATGLTMNTTLTAATVPVGSNAIPGNSFTQRLLWDSSFRGRVGIIWNNVLLYGTGGLALAGTKFSASFQPTSAAGLPFPGGYGTADAVLVGYTAGGGLEYKVTPNWILGVEGRYSSYETGNYSLGTRSTFGGGTAAAPVFAFAPVSASDKFWTAVGLFKVNYLFH